MKFKDLLDLAYDENTEQIDIEALQKELPETPKCVLEQVYSAHGRKYDFQEQYAEIDISSLVWEKTSIPACKIISCTYYQVFRSWFENVASRAENFYENSWKCVDTRQEVVKNWQNENTWIIPPVFISGKTKDKLHLIEGHTRVGLLKGLVDKNIISNKSNHEVWIGRTPIIEFTKTQEHKLDC